MNYNFIRDPITNKFYRSTSKKGLSIFKRYIIFLNGSGRDSAVDSNNDMIRKLELEFNNIRDEAHRRRVAENKGLLSGDELPLNWWRSLKEPIDAEFGESPLDEYEWGPPIYDKEVLPIKHEKQDDFHKDGDLKGEPDQHFINQTVRIPKEEKKGPTPRKLLQLALNVGQGLADGIIHTEWTMFDFIKKKN